MPEQFLYWPPQEYLVSRRQLAQGEAAEVFTAHRGYAVLYVAQGACQLDLGDRVLLADVGSAALLGPGLPYKLEAYGNTAAAVLLAEFSADCLQPLAGTMPGCDFTAFLQAEPLRLLCGLPAAAQRDVRCLLEKQLALCALPDPAPAVCSEGRLLLAALLLELEGLCATHCRRGDSWQLAQLLRRYIAAHYAEKLDLSVLSSRFHTSRSHLCHAFKAGTGQSPIEYLNHTRVQAACALLQSPAPPDLDEIARRCGFSGPAQLRRLFRQELALSPRQYRRQMHSRG